VVEIEFETEPQAEHVWEKTEPAPANLRPLEGVQVPVLFQHRAEISHFDYMIQAVVGAEQPGGKAAVSLRIYPVLRGTSTLVVFYATWRDAAGAWVGQVPSPPIVGATASWQLPVATIPVESLSAGDIATMRATASAVPEDQEVVRGTLVVKVTGIGEKGGASGQPSTQPTR
jgi:hypothetical protein